jgi:hypothetical protein
VTWGIYIGIYIGDTHDPDGVLLIMLLYNDEECTTIPRKRQNPFGSVEDFELRACPRTR